MVRLAEKPQPWDTKYIDANPEEGYDDGYVSYLHDLQEWEDKHG